MSLNVSLQELCRVESGLRSCLLFSTLAHTSLLVIDLHGSFSSEYSLEACCGDLTQTGHAYSAAEKESANAVVLIVLVL